MWIIVQFVVALTLDLLLLAHAPLVWVAYRIGVIVARSRTVECCRPARRHIILLHGSGFNQSQWVLAKLYLRYFLADDSVHIHSFDYANQFTNEPGDGIDTYVHGVIRKRIKEISAVDPSVPIALIGHSMGGLAAADYAGNVATSEGVLVDRCIPLCAPWRGAPVLSNSSCTKTKRRYAQMMPGSEYLRRLTARWQSGDSSLSRLLCVGSTTDLLVPEQQWYFEGARTIPGFNWWGHYGVLVSPSVWKAIALECGHSKAE